MRHWLLWLLLVLPAWGQSYLSAEEARVVEEVNLLRTRPQEYMRLLEGERAHYDGNLWRPGGKQAVNTVEGAAALEEAIAALRDQPPLTPLEASLGLTLAARDHVRDQGPRGATGHDGSDGSRPRDRTNRYGSGPLIGENIGYGHGTARDIVMQLLIDDGVPDRGHRLNLLKPDYRQIGVNIGPHQRYRVCCVMDFGSGYLDKSGLDASAPPSLPSPTVTAPVRTGGPLEQARGVALAHYQALVNDDRAAWFATWSPTQRGYLGQRWSAARLQGVGQTYRYGGTQKVSPTRMTLVFVRGNQRCTITLTLEPGGWKVEDASY